MANSFSFSGDDAQNYDQWLGPLLFEPASQEVMKRVEKFRPSSLLEIACGSGRLTRYLRAHFSNDTKMVASDISDDMLQLAKKNLNDSSITFKIADAQELPFEDNSFDLVVCQFGLMFLTDKNKGFREAFRVLKPGGHYIFSTWDSADHQPLINLIINQTIIPFFNFENKERFQTPFSLYDPKQLHTFVTDAGFKNINLSHVGFKAGESTPEAAANAFLLKHPLGRTVAEKDPDALQPMGKELIRQIGEQFGKEKINTELKAFIGVAEK